MLADLGNHRVARLGYDRSALEIRIPLSEHKFLKEIIGTAIQDIAEQLNRNYESYGFTTWKRELQQAGLESENCFYFQNEAAVRGSLDIDLNRGDPPPDLALEIDVIPIRVLNRNSEMGKTGKAVSF